MELRLSDKRSFNVQGRKLTPRCAQVWCPGVAGKQSHLDVYLHRCVHESNGAGGVGGA